MLRERPGWQGLWRPQILHSEGDSSYIEEGLHDVTEQMVSEAGQMASMVVNYSRDQGNWQRALKSRKQSLVWC
jgi:hypothetical protein